MKERAGQHTPYYTQQNTGIEEATLRLSKQGLVGGLVRSGKITPEHVRADGTINREALEQIPYFKENKDRLEAISDYTFSERNWLRRQAKIRKQEAEVQEAFAAASVQAAVSQEIEQEQQIEQQPNGHLSFSARIRAKKEEFLNWLSPKIGKATAIGVVPTIALALSLNGAGQANAESTQDHLTTNGQTQQSQLVDQMDRDGFIVRAFAKVPSPNSKDSRPTPIPDVEDQNPSRHPSGKDRNTEPVRSGTQGQSGADPDGGGTTDNRFPSNEGSPAGSQGSGDWDGNAGCGNDHDFSDDNKGKCLGPKHKETHTPQPKPTKTPEATLTPKPTKTPQPSPTPKFRICLPEHPICVPPLPSHTPTVPPTSTATPTPFVTSTPGPTETPVPTVVKPTPSGTPGIIIPEPTPTRERERRRRTPTPTPETFMPPPAMATPVHEVTPTPTPFVETPPEITTLPEETPTPVAQPRVPRVMPKGGAGGMANLMERPVSRRGLFDFLKPNVPLEI